MLQLPTPGVTPNWGPLINQALLELEAGQTYYLYQSGGTYPLRNTATTNPSSRVVWVGATAPPIGGGYAAGNDRWEQTT